MTRLTRCFLLLIFLSVSAQANPISKLLRKEWFRSSPDCLNQSLQFIQNKNLDADARESLEGAAHYNDGIYKKFSALSQEEWTPAIESTIDHFGKYDKKFDAASFKKWLKENPSEIKPNETVGEYLKRNHEPFIKKNPEGKIEDIVADADLELRAINKACKNDLPCNEKKITAMIAEKFNKTCIGKHKKEVLKSMITNLALTNIGYGVSTAKHPENGFPVDLMATNLIWTYIFTSVGCRNTFENSKIGGKINLGNRVTFSTETAKIKANNYISYMILSPLSNATYVGFHTMRQVYEGKKEWKDVHVWDLTKQVASLTLYDAIYPVPRTVFLTDPLYLKGIPAWGKYLDKKLPKVPAVGAQYLTDWGSRISLSFINTELVNKWVANSDDWWDTKFTGEKKQEDTKKPE